MDFPGIPEGTKDALPEEMRALRQITDRLRHQFEQAEYGEVYTPTVERQSTLALGDRSIADGAFKLLDEHGEVLVFRPDMTIPIARVAASSFASQAPPLRLYYQAHTYRDEGGRPSEMLESGVELLGLAAPTGTVEVLGLLCGCLDAVGLLDYRIGIGDATIYPNLLASIVPDLDQRKRIMHELSTLDFVGLEREVRAADLSPQDAELLIELPRIRGSSAVLGQDLDPTATGLMQGLRKLDDSLPDTVRSRAIYDLGLCRRPGYYTGTIFEVYDPAWSGPVGGGGHYDDLLGRFGRLMPAVGFSLHIESLHGALYDEGRKK